MKCPCRGAAPSTDSGWPTPATAAARPSSSCTAGREAQPTTRGPRPPRRRRRRRHRPRPARLRRVGPPRRRPALGLRRRRPGREHPQPPIRARHPPRRPRRLRHRQPRRPDRRAPRPRRRQGARAQPAAARRRRPRPDGRGPARVLVPALPPAPARRCARRRPALGGAGLHHALLGALERPRLHARARGARPPGRRLRPPRRLHGQHRLVPRRRRHRGPRDERTAAAPQRTDHDAGHGAVARQRPAVPAGVGRPPATITSSAPSCACCATPATSSRWRRPTQSRGPCARSSSGYTWPSGRSRPGTVGRERAARSTSGAAARPSASPARGHAGHRP